MSDIKVGLFGLGTVGEGIVNVIAKARNANAEIKRVCVRDASKKRNVTLPKEKITEDRYEILDDPDINLIVEVINDPDAAFEIVSEALKRGIPVVSGSKTMIARHLPELIKLQHENNVSLLYDASSCGSIPVIRNLEEYYDNDLLLEVKGILNGSSNYILSRVFDHNEPYEKALQTAIDLGFAEADPSFDIDGYDSLYKLIIITVHALGVYVAPKDIFTYGISHISDFDINYAREKRVKIKLVAQVVKLADNKFTMFVMPEFVTKSRYIYSVDDEYNGVVIRGECYDRQFMFGKGAGSLPTASSILSDMVAHHHGYRYEYKKMGYSDVPQYTTDILLKVYVRFSETPVPELLPFAEIQERYVSKSVNYVIGEIALSDLMKFRGVLDRPDVFIVNFSRFFEDLDQ
ncbi:MAG: homoserine dehydrogenase [Muribaculaceae bacterium]|nr:homoserine dehydrogenase [Muribaculaceae bacterium]